MVQSQGGSGHGIEPIAGRHAPITQWHVLRQRHLAVECCTLRVAITGRIILAEMLSQFHVPLPLGSHLTAFHPIIRSIFISVHWHVIAALPQHRFKDSIYQVPSRTSSPSNDNGACNGLSRQLAIDVANFSNDFIVQAGRTSQVLGQGASDCRLHDETITRADVPNTGHRTVRQTRFVNNSRADHPSVACQCAGSTVFSKLDIPPPFPLA